MKKSMTATTSSTESGRGQSSRSSMSEGEVSLLEGLSDEAVDSQMAAAKGSKGANGSSAKGRGSKAGAASKGAGDDEGMDPFELLKSHHQEVDSLFQEIEHSNQARGRKTILKEILIKLEAHARVEEKIFYPRGAKADADQTLECYEEHKLCRVLMRDLGRMDATDKLLMAKVKVLKDLVKHHVKEEEEEYFEKVRAKFSDKQLETLGVEMKDEYERIVQRLMGAGRTAASRRSKAPAGRSGKAKTSRATAASKKVGASKASKGGRAVKATGGRKSGRTGASAQA